MTYQMRPDKVQRNLLIWRARWGGANQTQIAESFHLTQTRVGEILRQCARDFPPEVTEQLKAIRQEVHDFMQRELMKIVEAPPKPAVAANGKQLVDPITGRPVYDHSERLAAIAAMMKLDERKAKLQGTDTPMQQTITVNQVAAEATKSAAEKITSQFPSLEASLN